MDIKAGINGTPQGIPGHKPQSPKWGIMGGTKAEMKECHPHSCHD